MINRLGNAYANPTEKFCYYTGQNHAEIAKALGLQQWDWTPQPTANIGPYFWNTHTIPLCFGCPPKITSEGKEWIEPRITDPQQVHDVEIPDVSAGRSGEILDLAANMLRELPEDNLIRLPDVQSPLGVCELMWDQNFYMALLTNPEEVLHLVDKVTTFLIKYIKAFQELLGDRYNPACHPQVWSGPSGYYISDDANSMISPDMHKTLCIDIINRITDECGPVFYHSCTYTDPYMENIKQIRNAKAMNWSVGTSMAPADIITTFSGKTILAPHLGKDMHTETGVTSLGLDINDEVDMFRYFLNSMQDNTTMYIVIHDNLLDDVEKVVRIYKLFDEYGYTPQAAGVV